MIKHTGKDVSHDSLQSGHPACAKESENIEGLSGHRNFPDHADGSWLNDGGTVVPMMIKACTDTDESYWFNTIWDKSPVYEAPAE